MAETMRSRHGRGLAWGKFGDGSWQGRIARHLSGEERGRATEVAGLKPGDTLLMMAGARDKIRPLMGDLRLQLGSKFEMRKPDDLRFLWVVDFPLFEYSEEEKRMMSVNHPFTAPHPDDLNLLDTEPLKARALAYDMVLNGQEMGGGSIRIHNPELPLKVFGILGLSSEEAAGTLG